MSAMSSAGHPIGPTKPGDTQLARLIEASLEGNPRARDELLHHACDRLFALTRRMFRNRPGLRRWEQTDDVFQNAMVRLHRALSATEVRSVRHFFNLASVQIRRELIDLGRKHFGPHGIGRNHHTDHQPSDERGGSLQKVEAEPGDVEEWTDFHERVEALPADVRELVGLLYYEGLSHDEVAGILGVSIRTLRRRWQEAKLLLLGGVSDGRPEPGDAR